MFQYEFLIKRIDGDWFSLHNDKYEQVLKPFSILSSPVEGWGNWRISIPNGTIAFADEDPGIHVIFENYSGSQKDAYNIVTEILKNIETETNQKGKIIEL